MSKPAFDIEQLTPAERLELIERLWDSLSNGSDPTDVRSPEWHRQEVRAAQSDHEATPTTARPWSEVRAEIEAKLKRR